jgi:hypothetical protein
MDEQKPAIQLEALLGSLSTITASAMQPFGLGALHAIREVEET